MLPAVAGVLLLALAAGAPSPSLRGVDPDLAASYLGKGGTFKCLDGSKTLPFERVNDDYCDCADGSDEPGTSACHNGKFYCANKGHEAKRLSSVFVDDGVCDCCDGTDELMGCKNKCLELHAETKKQLQAAVDQQSRSLGNKAELIEKSANKRQEWASRLQTIDDELEQKKAQVVELQKKLEEEEVARRKLQEEQEAARAAEEARRAEEETARAAAEQEAAEAFQQADVTEAPPTDTPPVEEHHEETPEERGRRIAAQWTHDPEAALPVEHGHEEGHEGSHEGGQEEDSWAEGEQQQEYERENDDWNDDPDFERENDEPYDPPEHQDDNHHDHHHHHHHHHAQDTARDLEDAKKAIETMERDKINMQRWLQSKMEFGPKDMFLAWAGKCFTDHGHRFNYKACIFDYAQQFEPHNPSNIVNLGMWAGFTDDKTLVFHNGDPCQGAPNRSYRITLECGETERLHGSEEPSTCVYTAKLTTPLACSDAEHQQALAKLQEHEAWEQQILEEIMREEAEKAAAAGQPAKKSVHDEL